MSIAEPETLPLPGARPYAFLVTTTGWAKTIGTSLGSAGYSYYFAYEGLRPVLEELGVCSLVERPESRLALLADEARAAGYEPVHLAINPAQDVYLTPAVRTIVMPFWEFPDVPNRNFGTDARQNWARVLRKADAVAAPCSFTAEAIRRAVAGVPIGILPVPLRPADFELPDWSPEASWTFRGRHAVWRTERDHVPAPESRAPGRWSGLFDRLEPILGPRTLQRLCLFKRRWTPDPGESFAGRAFQNLRGAYTRHVRRWLSDDAVALVTRVKRKLLKLAGVPEKVTTAPGLPVGEIALSGTIYTTILNVGDPRKNPEEILSAFLLAFRDRADVALVVKLVTNPVRENHEVGILRSMYERLGIDHACPVVVITEFLDDAGMDSLFRATTFYVNHSFGEGACLPLQRALAGGRPALAPDHSAMRDYIDGTVAYVTRSFPEPTHWPHDPERRIETTRSRPVWSDLRDHFVESERTLRENPARHRAMSAAARERMRGTASRRVARAALESLLRLPARRAPGAWDWSEAG